MDVQECGSVYLTPEWRELLVHVPGPSTQGRTAMEIYSLAQEWRRSTGQLAHALRMMRNKGILDSPSRGRFRLTSAGIDAMRPAS